MTGLWALLAVGCVLCGIFGICFIVAGCIEGSRDSLMGGVVLILISALCGFGIYKFVEFDYNFALSGGFDIVQEAGYVQNISSKNIKIDGDSFSLFYSSAVANVKLCDLVTFKYCGDVGKYLKEIVVVK